MTVKKFNVTKFLIHRLHDKAKKVLRLVPIDYLNESDRVKTHLHDLNIRRNSYPVKFRFHSILVLSFTFSSCLSVSIYLLLFSPSSFPGCFPKISIYFYKVGSSLKVSVNSVSSLLRPSPQNILRRDSGFGLKWYVLLVDLTIC